VEHVEIVLHQFYRISQFQNVAPFRGVHHRFGIPEKRLEGDIEAFDECREIFGRGDLSG
jgi:hypothetical protein